MEEGNLLVAWYYGKGRWGKRGSEREEGEGR